MPDELPNWRFYVAFDNVFDDPNATFASNTEAAHRGIDAVVAAVRADVHREFANAPTTLGYWLREGRRDAARDCASRIEFGERAARFFARIAEGTSNRG